MMEERHSLMEARQQWVLELTHFLKDMRVSKGAEATLAFPYKAMMLM